AVAATAVEHDAVVRHRGVDAARGDGRAVDRARRGGRRLKRLLDDRGHLGAARAGERDRLAHLPGERVVVVHRRYVAGADRGQAHGPGSGRQLVAVHAAEVAPLLAGLLAHIALGRPHRAVAAPYRPGLEVLLDETVVIGVVPRRVAEVVVVRDHAARRARQIGLDDIGHQVLVEEVVDRAGLALG